MYKFNLCISSVVLPDIGNVDIQGYQPPGNVKKILLMGNYRNLNVYSENLVNFLKQLRYFLAILKTVMFSIVAGWMEDSWYCFMDLVCANQPASGSQQNL